MTDSTAFSASGEDVISRPISVKTDGTADPLFPEQFDEYYEIARTANEIALGDYKRIALQFPDELLHHSVPIFRALKMRVKAGCELYVLADTSYGSCCVDEVAASHVDADAMVHYGHACMSKTYRLPVIYVFGKKPIDAADCAMSLTESLRAFSADSTEWGVVLLKHDVAYAHQADAILAALCSTLPDTPIAHTPLCLTSRPEQPISSEGEPKAFDPSFPGQEIRTVLYVGPESLALTNLLMTHASCKVHSYDPATRTARLESARTNKLLMRRYAALQRARDADVFGILVGTLGVASYLPLISHLRALLRRAHKKSYTVSVGKLNPAKLGNFMEIECFVLVACPENSLIDGKDFIRPIVTPYELEVALRAEQSWTGRYVLDFEKLLAESSAEEPRVERGEQDSDEDDLDSPMFSLTSGTYRHARRYGDGENLTSQSDGPSTAMIRRNQDTTVALADSAAGEFLLARSWRGLDTRVGEDAPSMLEQGRSGIARGYDEDQAEDC